MASKFQSADFWTSLDQFAQDPTFGLGLSASDAEEFKKMFKKEHRNKVKSLKTEEMEVRLLTTLTTALTALQLQFLTHVISRRRVSFSAGRRSTPSPHDHLSNPNPNTLNTRAVVEAKATMQPRNLFVTKHSPTSSHL